MGKSVLPTTDVIASAKVAQALDKDTFDARWFIAWAETGKELAAGGAPSAIAAANAARDVTIAVELTRNESQQDAAAAAGVKPPTVTAAMHRKGLGRKRG